MTQSILSSAFTQPKFTASSEVDGTILWRKLGIEGVDITETSANTDSPLSDEQWNNSGTFRTLFEKDVESIKIITPSQVRVRAITDDISIIESIIQSFLDVRLTIAIYTKSVIAYHLALVGVELEQSAEVLSAARINLMFEQVQQPADFGYNPEQPPDANVHGISIQVPKSVPFFGSSLLTALSNFTLPPDIITGGPLFDAEGGPFILDVSKLA